MFNDAVELDIAINNILQETCMNIKSPLIQVEDDLLSLSTTDSVDAIFYCCFMKMKLGEKVEVIYSRYFESGAFDGFYRNVCLPKMKEALSIAEVCAVSAYTSLDIEEIIKHKSGLFTERKKGCRTVYFIHSFIFTIEIFFIFFFFFKSFFFTFL